MKCTGVGLLIVGPIIAINACLAATMDDVKSINQCVKDNQTEAAKKEVVVKYCTCMNNKMGRKETQSIKEWEKSHLAEQRVCNHEAGWE